MHNLRKIRFKILKIYRIRILQDNLIRRYAAVIIINDILYTFHGCFRFSLPIADVSYCLILICLGGRKEYDILQTVHTRIAFKYHLAGDVAGLEGGNLKDIAVLDNRQLPAAFFRSKRKNCRSVLR